MNGFTTRWIWIYRKLAGAFPEEFQRLHGDQMRVATEDLIRDVANRQGFRGLFPLMPRILTDLIVRIPVEHTREFSQDLRYGMRTLARSPGFTVAAILSVGIAIGFSVSTYSQLEMALWSEIPGTSGAADLLTFQRPVSFPDFERYRESRLFSDVMAYMSPVPFTIDTGERPERIWGHLVTPNYFDLLAARTIRGRRFTTEESTMGGPSVAVIGYDLWKNRFGAREDMVGRTIRLNGQPVTIVGITVEGFRGAAPLLASADVWVPTTAPVNVAPELDPANMTNVAAATFKPVGRLRQGVAVEQAEAALDTLARNLEKERTGREPESSARRVGLIPASRPIPVRDEQLPVLVATPFVMVGLMLWIACSNVGTFLLARGAARRKEIAVRLAMGASRGRILRQLVTESMLLALLGGAAGLILAVWSNRSLDWLKPLIPGYVHIEIPFSWSAFFFALGLSSLAGLFFGLAPALQAARVNVATGLKGGATAHLRGYRWFSSRNFMVFQQVAGSLMLLLITGFVSLGFMRSNSGDLGFDPAGLYLMSLDPIRDGYSADQATAFFKGLPEQLKQAPGVLGATLSYKTPLGMFAAEDGGRPVTTGNLRGAAERLRSIRVERVGAGFFETIGIPIVRGRAFGPSDQTGDTRVAIVNQTMAEQEWPGKDSLGQNFEYGGKTHEVVGVARDFRTGRLMESVQPGIFLPIEPRGFARPSDAGVTLIIRAAPGVDMPRLIRSQLDVVDPGLTLFNVSLMSHQVEQMMYVVRISALLYGGMGLFGLVLAAVGLAGVTAYAVAQRTREIGIRIALGAPGRSVIGLVLKEGAALVALGTVSGFAAAYGTMRVLGAYFDTLAEITNTSSADPILLLGGPLLLGALTMLSCYIPARRSLRIDPLVALREE